MFTVPVVDLSSAPSSAVTDALRTASCCFVVGHGVDPALRDEMETTSRAFFAQPRAAKAPTRWDGTGLWSGWQPVFEGHPEYTGDRVPDPLERFEIQLSGEGGPGGATHDDLRDGYTHWPATPSQFADVWTRYYQALGGLANRLTHDMATTLDLPAQDETAWTAEHFANLVAINYLPGTVLPEAEERARQHTDRGGFTLLWADDAPGGLEVMLIGAREWVPVQIPRNAFLLQAGDLLARWTNKKIRPNIHRVVNPPTEAADRGRLSLVYFHYPRLDALIAPAPSCLSGDRPAARAVLAGEHVFARQEGYRKFGDDESVTAILDDGAYTSVS